MLRSARVDVVKRRQPKDSKATPDHLGYPPAAIEKILAIKHAAVSGGGDFVLLWHNSHLLCPEDREFFRAAIL